MTPADTPKSDSTGSYHSSPTPGRVKLSNALQECIEKTDQSSFRKCAEAHAGEIAEWIECELREHFFQLWQSKKCLPNR